jgi:hypothetical protein
LEQQRNGAVEDLAGVAIGDLAAKARTSICRRLLPLALERTA